MIGKHNIKQIIERMNTGYIGKPDQDVLIPLLEAQIPVEVSRQRTNSGKCPSCSKLIRIPTGITRRQTGWFCDYCGQMLKYTQDS